MAAKSAGSDSVASGADTTLFDSSIKTAGKIINWACATDQDILVNVAGLHKSDEYFTVKAGESITFHGPITAVYAHASSTTATVRHGIVSSD